MNDWKKFETIARNMMKFIARPFEALRPCSAESGAKISWAGGRGW